MGVRMTKRWIAIWMIEAVVLTMWFGGCAVEPQNPDYSETKRALEAPSVPPRTDPLASASPAPNLPLVGQTVPVPIIRQIDWKAAKAGPQLDEGLLREDQLTEVSGAPLPLLVPNRPALLKTAKIMSGPHWVAATMYDDGHQVYVHGTRVEHVVPTIEVSKAGQEIFDRGFVVTRNEGITTLSLKTYGGAYSVSVDCDDHENDTRCIEDSYVVELANALVMAGGAP